MKALIAILFISSVVLSQDSAQISAFKELKNIDSVYNSSLKRWYHPESTEARKKAMVDKSKWNEKYPMYARILQVEKKSSIMKGAGTVQLLSGVAGAILTIIDANRTIEINGESYQNEWGMGYTVLAILSGGLVLSGAITISF